MIPYAVLLKKEKELSALPKSYKLFSNIDNLYKKPEQLDDFHYLKRGLFYIDGEDLETNLLFEKTDKSPLKYKHKILKMTDVAGRAKNKPKYDALRNAPSAEMSAEFQNLLKQGYVIREILASNEIYILFERPEKQLFF